jgi:hypothetical protein
VLGWSDSRLYMVDAVQHREYAYAARRQSIVEGDSGNRSHSRGRPGG